MKIEIDDTFYYDFLNLGKDIDIIPVLKYALQNRKLRYRKYYAVEVVYRAKKNNKMKRFLVHKNKLFDFKISFWPDILKFPEPTKKKAIKILKKFNQENFEKGLKKYDDVMNKITKGLDDFSDGMKPQDRKLNDDLFKSKNKDDSFLTSKKRDNFL